MITSDMPYELTYLPQHRAAQQGMRQIRRVFGSMFAALAVGLWILPGSSWAQDVAILKIGVTIALCSVAVMCILPRRV